jgi:hypothetical protein
MINDKIEPKKGIIPQCTTTENILLKSNSAKSWIISHRIAEVKINLIIKNRGDKTIPMV